VTTKNNRGLPDMNLEEFINIKSADTGFSSGVGNGYGWGSGAGCFASVGYDGLGSGKCIEWINGAGYGSGFGDGCGDVHGSGR
jgi:hypothetical protein